MERTNSPSVIEVTSVFSNMFIFIFIFIILPFVYIALGKLIYRLYIYFIIRHRIKYSVIQVSEFNNITFNVEVTFADSSYTYYLTESEILELDELIIQSKRKIKENIRNEKLRIRQIELNELKKTEISRNLVSDIQLKIRNKNNIIKRFKGIFK